MRPHRLVFALALLALGVVPVFAKEQPVDDARDQLAKLQAQLDTLDAWQAHAERVRHGILETAGLHPLPEKTALNPVRRQRRQMDGYVVENVAFEAFPGFYVTGNLYRPDEPEPARGAHAGVLVPHGHFPPGEDTGEGRFRREVQLKAATLARAGAVVLAWDMVGWGESEHTEHREDPNALGLQLWSAIRAVDFLLSLEQVDPDRIGVTGASGGGTQSFLLAAVDDRVAASAPLVMVSAYFFGGCNCESGIPIHEGEGYATNNADVAALAAPRPQLLVSVGGDWTDRTPELEYPYLQHVYGLHDAEERVRNAHFPDEGHDLGPSKRHAVYRFFADVLELDAGRIEDAQGEFDETPVTVLPREQLEVFDGEHPRPGDYLRGQAAIEQAFFDR